MQLDNLIEGGKSVDILHFYPDCFIKIKLKNLHPSNITQDGDFNARGSKSDNELGSAIYTTES